MGSLFDKAMRDMHATVHETFGEPIESYTRPGPEPIILPTLTAIFRTKANADHVLAGDVPVDGTEPKLKVRNQVLGDLGVPVRGDTFTARGQPYVVERVIPGTIGYSVCHCTEASE